MTRRAFTLVELLVVIAIIGLLSTVAVVSIGSSRTKSRNTKRIADIKQLMVAFNLGRDASSTGAYPASSGFVCVSASCYGGWSGYAAVGTIDAFIAPYMAAKPTDPSDGGSRGYGGYIYNSSWAGGTFGSYGYFPPGTIIDFLLEGVISDCGLGKKSSGLAAYSEFAVYLD